MKTNLAAGSMILNVRNSNTEFPMMIFETKLQDENTMNFDTLGPMAQL